MLDLTGRNQLLNCSRNIFDWHFGINTVLVKEIDAICLQTLQCRVCHSFDMIRPTVSAAAARARFEVYIEAELGGDYYLVTNWLQRFTEQRLIGERPIGFGSVEHRDPTVMRSVDELNHIALFGARSINSRHTHAAEANG
ncbi:hypothetical protein D9M69_640050 [compost metagenome]